MKKELEALEELFLKIEQGATGLELAYEAEKNNDLPQLYYNGIFFIETFKKIGGQVFIESPDVQVKIFDSFKTKEESEKSIFMKWINREISERKETLYPRSDYLKFKEMMERQEKVSKMGTCPYCGAFIKDKSQKYCESCGMQFL